MLQLCVRKTKLKEDVLLLGRLVYFYLVRAISEELFFYHRSSHHIAFLVARFEHNARGLDLNQHISIPILLLEGKFDTLKADLKIRNIPDFEFDCVFELDSLSDLTDRNCI